MWPQLKDARMANTVYIVATLCLSMELDLKKFLIRMLGIREIAWISLDLITQLMRLHIFSMDSSTNIFHRSVQHVREKEEAHSKFTHYWFRKMKATKNLHRCDAAFISCCQIRTINFKAENIRKDLLRHSFSSSVRKRRYSWPESIILFSSIFP